MEIIREKHKKDKEGESVMELTNRPFYTPTEALRSGLAPVGRSVFYRMLRNGEIPSKRIGHKVIIPKRAFLAWLETVDTPEAR